MEIELAKELTYREIIGSLMYFAIVSRPDIMFSGTRLARYFSGWNMCHWKMAKNIMRYVSASKDIRLMFGFDDDIIIGYTDSDHAGDNTTRKATEGIVFCRAGGAFDWSSKMQSVGTHSSAEIAQERSGREALWIRKLCYNSSIDVTTIDIRAHNQGAISIVKYFKENVAKKLISIAYHLTRIYVADNLVSISYIPTLQMVADCMTKALDKVKFTSNQKRMGL